jgi:hypothetical protein
MYTNFSVNGFQTAHNNILITVEKLMHEPRQVKIKREDFEAWVDRTGRLAVDHGIYNDDELKDFPVIQTRTFFEYYQSPDIFADLADYLLIKQGEEAFEIIAVGIKNICKQHEHLS